MGTSLHPITNRPKYNKSLINRGSLTFWVDAEAMNNWFRHGHHGRRGRSQLYTDQTLSTLLMLKGIFNISLRVTQGLLDSLFELMNVPLCAPDYSCVSKRASTVEVAYRQPPKGKVTDVVIDSTALKVFGEGEWKVRQHGHDKRKLHLAVDPAIHDIVAAEACIPPRKNAGLWGEGHPRNEVVLVMRKEGLAHWKQQSGYHRRSLAETAMNRFKQLMTGKISLRNYNGQVGEIMAYVCAMNKLNALGLLVREPQV
ncbi:IS5 family transposase [Aeromonas veronii]|uniref:IS5 family transposase n=1 Tax=Aeromonas veronii TaxID=654 RepID=UPI003CE6FE1A